MQNNSSSTEKLRLYLGYAPGKTTALNGVVMRSLGANLKVKLILFSKYPENTSESNIYKIFSEYFGDMFSYFFAGISRIRSDGSFRYFGDPDGWNEKDELMLNEGIKMLSSDMSSGEYDILCADELTDFLYHKGYKIDQEKIKSDFSSIHLKTKVIVSGHLCPRWLIDLATTVIEGKLIKHYKGYTKGIEW